MSLLGIERCAAAAGPGRGRPRPRPGGTSRGRARRNARNLRVVETEQPGADLSRPCPRHLPPRLGSSPAAGYDRQIRRCPAVGDGAVSITRQAGPVGVDELALGATCRCRARRRRDDLAWPATARSTAGAASPARAPAPRSRLARAGPPPGAASAPAPAPAARTPRPAGQPLDRTGSRGPHRDVPCDERKVSRVSNCCPAAQAAPYRAARWVVRRSPSSPCADRCRWPGRPPRPS